MQETTSSCRHSAIQKSFKKSRAITKAKKTRTDKGSEIIADELITCVWPLRMMAVAELERQCRIWSHFGRPIRCYRGHGRGNGTVRLHKAELVAVLEVRVVLGRWQHRLWVERGFPATVTVGSPFPPDWGWDLAFRIAGPDGGCVELQRTNPTRLVCRLARLLCEESPAGWPPLRATRTSSKEKRGGFKGRKRKLRGWVQRTPMLCDRPRDEGKKRRAKRRRSHTEEDKEEEKEERDKDRTQQEALPWRYVRPIRSKDAD